MAYIGKRTRPFQAAQVSVRSCNRTDEPKRGVAICDAVFVQHGDELRTDSGSRHLTVFLNTTYREPDAHDHAFSRSKSDVCEARWRRWIERSEVDKTWSCEMGGLLPRLARERGKMLCDVAEKLTGFDQISNTYTSMEGQNKIG